MAAEPDWSSQWSSTEENYKPFQFPDIPKLQKSDGNGEVKGMNLTLQRRAVLARRIWQLTTGV
jgi:hypothetical protein